MATSKIEKFQSNDLNKLRNELLESGLDSFQAAQVLSVFLTCRGYGIGAEEARAMVLSLDHRSCSPACIQREIERVARVM